jgi:hypothetical protein
MLVADKVLIWSEEMALARTFHSSDSRWLGQATGADVMCYMKCLPAEFIQKLSSAASFGAELIV